MCISRVISLSRAPSWVGMSPGGGGEGVLPYVAYKGMCRWTGYGFWPLCPIQGI